LPAAASASSARCTVRWLAPSASANAELDHASPSASSASTAAWRSSTTRASTTMSAAPSGSSAKPSAVAVSFASGRSIARRRPISTRRRARCESSACLARNAAATSAFLDTSRGHASPSTRASVNSTGRRASDTLARIAHGMPARVDDQRVRLEQRLYFVEPHEPRCPAAMSRAAGVSSARAAVSTSALSAAMPACCAAARGLARAPRARMRRIAMPAAISSCAARDAGGSAAGSSCASCCSASSTSDQQQPAHAEITRMGRVRAIAVRVERRACGVECARRPAQIARRQRDLGLRDHARACDGFVRAERARRRAHERARALEVAELRQRDAAQRERGRVAAQCDAVQRAERVAAASARAAAVISESMRIPTQLSLLASDPGP
jgi:hypothetical protein